MDLQKHWWLVALVSALGAVALLLVASFLRTPFAVGLLVLGVAVFLIVLYFNPSGRYLKLASCLATSWLSIRKGPYLLVSSWEEDSVGRLLVSQQIGSWFDITLGCVISLLLILDFISNEPEGVLRGLLRRVTISLGSRMQQVTGGSPQQAHVGDIHGDHVQIIIDQKQGISATEMHEIVRASAPNANTEIDLAAERLKSGESQVALHLLSDLRKRRWDQLSDRERFRLLANLGHIHEKKGDLNEAAREYLEARTYQKDEEQARSLEAVAHFMLGDNAKAHRLSLAILADHPHSLLANAVRIRTEPESVGLSEIERTIPITVKKTPEVLNAMGWRAAATGNFEAAEQLAREALELKPDIPELKEQLGCFIMMKEARDADNELDRVWTQQLLHYLLEVKKIPADLFNEFTVFLVAANYSFTRLVPGSFLLAAHKASWEPEIFPFNMVISWFGKPEILDSGLCGTLAGALLQVWRNAPLSHQKEAVTVALFNAVLSRPDGVNLLAILHRSADSIFGVDVLATQGCKNIIERLLRLRQGRIILPG